MIDMKIERRNTLSKLLIILFNNISLTYLLTTDYNSLYRAETLEKTLEFILKREKQKN
jgi:hypothetical protein